MLLKNKIMNHRHSITTLAVHMTLLKSVVLSIQENHTGGGTRDGDIACTSSSMASTSIGEFCAPATVADTSRRLPTTGMLGELPTTGELASKFTTTLSADPSCDSLLGARLVLLMVLMLSFLSNEPEIHVDMV
jgi:hypothetical protein